MGHVGSSSFTGDQTRPPALGVQWSLSHRTTREVLRVYFFFFSNEEPEHGSGKTRFATGNLWPQCGELEELNIKSLLLTPNQI